MIERAENESKIKMSLFGLEETPFFEACNLYGVEREGETSEQAQEDSPDLSPRCASETDFSTFDIVKATQYGALERCKELVEAGFDVNKRDSENVTLLHWAAINNRKEIVSFYHIPRIG
ncbi:Palmitoyltransferase Hip14 [Armadillidium nasatum]|uniref:Palmitoyltransferase Hip14 n=1 Tax=Armadillidium nasatum TaxID=96803 RepID=A0A5N5SQV5_9CRUS|nr:Palmitoyltransferase Hip14 [Armadillidium nasatum]